MQAEAYLKQVKKIDAIIARKNQESEQLKAVGINANFESEIAELWEKRKSIIATIQSLPLEEYNVLWELYVNREDRQLKELPDIFNRSYRWAKETKKRALEHLQIILDNK